MMTLISDEVRRIIERQPLNNLSKSGVLPAQSTTTRPAQFPAESIPLNGTNQMAEEEFQSLCQAVST